MSVLNCNKLYKYHLINLIGNSVTTTKSHNIFFSIHHCCHFLYHSPTNGERERILPSTEQKTMKLNLLYDEWMSRLKKQSIKYRFFFITIGQNLKGLNTDTETAA